VLPRTLAGLWEEKGRDGKANGRERGEEKGGGRDGREGRRGKEGGRGGEKEGKGGRLHSPPLLKNPGSAPVLRDILETRMLGRSTRGRRQIQLVDELETKNYVR